MSCCQEDMTLSISCIHRCTCTLCVFKLRESIFFQCWYFMVINMLHDASKITDVFMHWCINCSWRFYVILLKRSSQSSTDNQKPDENADHKPLPTNAPFADLNHWLAFTVSLPKSFAPKILFSTQDHRILTKCNISNIKNKKWHFNCKIGQFSHCNPRHRHQVCSLTSQAIQALK